MEKVRKLSLKRKRTTLDTGGKKAEPNKNTNSTTCSNIAESKSKTKKIQSQPIQQTPDPFSWQALPPFPPWINQEQCQNQQSKDENSKEITIQITEDIQIQWTPLPPFCKKCLLQQRPPRNPDNFKKPLQEVESCKVDKGFIAPINQENRHKPGLQSVRSSDSEGGQEDDDNKSFNKLAKGRNVYQDSTKTRTSSLKVNQNKHMVTSVPTSSANKHTKSASNLKTFVPISKADKITKSNPRILKASVRNTPAAFQESTSSKTTSGPRSESSESENETFTKFGSRNQKIGKKFVPFTPHGSVPKKKIYENEFKVSHPNASSLSSKVANKIKQSQTTSTSLAGKSSNAPNRSLTDTKIADNRTKQGNTKSYGTSDSTSLTTDDDDPLGGLTDEDLITILSSDEEGEDIQTVKSVPAKKDPPWKPTSGGEKKKSSEGPKSKSSQNRTKQIKASSQKKQASKTPSRTIFDYAKKIPSTSTNQTTFQKLPKVHVNTNIPQGQRSHQGTLAGQSSTGSVENDMSGGENGLQCCPLCQLVFKAGWDQFQKDGHIAACLAESTDDVTW